VGWRALCYSISLLMLTAACSSAHAAGQIRTVSNPRACDVVTASAAASVLGTAVAPNTAPHIPAWTCTYLGERLDAKTHLPASASATLQRGSRSTLARMFELRQAGRVRIVPNNAPKPPPPRVVPGVGDEALWDGTWLLTRDGEWLLSVSVRARNGPDIGRSIALARVGLHQLAR
jgi:hypothetical protein